MTRRPSLPTISDESEAPIWAQALDDKVQTLARAQSRLSLRIDELMHLLDERLPRDAAEAKDKGQGPCLVEPDPTPLLDVLDRLDEARWAVFSELPAIERGLASIGARLEGLLGAMGIERRAEVGIPVNPELFRVVSVKGSPSAQDDMVIIRVIRAAALRGGHLLREGEVVIGFGSPTKTLLESSGKVP